MHLTINGRTPAGWRIDDMDNLSEGMDFIRNPFAVSPSQDNAERIVKAFEAVRLLVNPTGHLDNCMELRSFGVTTCTRQCAAARAALGIRE